MKPVGATLLAAPLLLAACGGGSDAGDPTVAPDLTEQPSTSEPAPTVDTEQEWDLLYISDSGGFGVAERYGSLAEEALGLTVNVHDRARGDLQATKVLERIQDESNLGWAPLIREAEIIVVFGNPRQAGATADLEICITGSTHRRDPPVRYSAADWQPYRDLLDEIYAEIWRQRDGEPVVLRAVDFYNPVISAWREAEIETECVAALESFNRTIAEAAEAGGATLVSVADVFNGPTHT
ncbi:MAG: hypothetical protein HKN80_06900, partial [Acidimicrobiia bacterium]|nr:hypothetical protein [Acidimicrobiia bacterium]